jgi:hypothetical protein
MREYTKILDRNQTRSAIKRFYGNDTESKQIVLDTIEYAITNNLTKVNNFSPCMRGEDLYGYFSFTYIGGKRFKCTTTFPELLEVR